MKVPQTENLIIVVEIEDIINYGSVLFFYCQNITISCIFLQILTNTSKKLSLYCRIILGLLTRTDVRFIIQSFATTDIEKGGKMTMESERKIPYEDAIRTELLEEITTILSDCSTDMLVYAKEFLKCAHETWEK